MRWKDWESHQVVSERRNDTIALAFIDDLTRSCHVIFCSVQRWLNKTESLDVSCSWPFKDDLIIFVIFLSLQIRLNEICYLFNTSSRTISNRHEKICDLVSRLPVHLQPIWQDPRFYLVISSYFRARSIPDIIWLAMVNLLSLSRIGKQQ